MEDIIKEIIYSSLTNIVPNTLAILVPLVGAFWIFKIREKTVAEGKIFELGREIANIFQSKEIRGPIDCISYVYIDKALHKIEEKNRERAIKEILREHLYCHKFGEDSTEEDEREAANIVVAVAAERLQSLIPSSVNWSGKGSIYNPHGEDIETKDNYFPFGTKLYRQWIERFGDIYNDLWTITNSRRFFIEKFLKRFENSSIDNNRKLVDNWLDEIDSRIKAIHPIHTKLLTQVQIIDTQINLSRLGKDIGFISFYGFLLLFSGFFAPKIIYLLDLSSLASLLNLTIATILSFLLVGIRVISAVQPVKEKNIQRKIFMPKLSGELESMEKLCMRYKPYVINDILSLDSDLKLSKQLKEDLTTLVDKIEAFNKYASILYMKTEEYIDSIKVEFETREENQQGFSIKTLDLASKEYELEDIKARIMKEDYNFIFSYEEIHSSRDIFKINLSELDRRKRLDLCERLDSLRLSIQSLSLYKTTTLALSELQESRKIALAQVEKSYNKKRQSDA